MVVPTSECWTLNQGGELRQLRFLSTVTGYERPDHINIEAYPELRLFDLRTF
jgi:hypothetical protein